MSTSIPSGLTDITILVCWHGAIDWIGLDATMNYWLRKGNRDEQKSSSIPRRLKPIKIPNLRCRQARDDLFLPGTDHRFYTPVRLADGINSGARG